jgi:spore germination protein YaaH
MPLKKLLRKNFSVVTAVKPEKQINPVAVTPPTQNQLPTASEPVQAAANAQPAQVPSQQPAPTPPPAPKPKTVAGWLPSWDTDAGLKTLTDFKTVFNEISPFWYGVDISGMVTPSPGAENGAVINTARTDGDRLIPTVANAFDGQKISEILHDPNRYRWHIALLVDKAVNSNYDGIDLDYENLKPEDRDLYSQFVFDLAQALHAKGKLLTVTVQPKTQEPGEIPSTRAHNYAALGQAADYIRIMAYDKHYSGGPPGPVAPLSWVDQVVAFAVSQIPKEKIILGIPTYGYDWPLTAGGKGKSVVHDQAAAVSFSRGAPVNWDAGSATPFINYNDGDVNRVIWFENAQSIQAKVDLVKKYDLAGVVFWRLGREDKSSYLQLSQKLNP